MTYKITSDKEYQEFLQNMETVGVLWVGGDHPKKMKHLFRTYTPEGTLYLTVNNKVLTWSKHCQEERPRMSWEDEGISKDTGRAYTTVASMDSYFG